MCIFHITWGKKETTEKEDKNEESDIYRELNHVYFHSEVNQKSINTLLCKLREAEDYCNTTKHKLDIPVIPIFLHINSTGGDVTPSFIAVDFIRSCKTPIHSIVEGECASAASYMSIVCEKRYITPSSYMMIHQISCCTEFDKLGVISDTYHYFTSIDRKIKNIYLKHTRLTPEKLEHLWKLDKWLNAKKCIKYGFVDEKKK